MKKIAIVRGPSLNPWEMQMYGALNKKFDITAIGSKSFKNDSTISFSVKKLTCIAEYFTHVPKMIPVFYRMFGDTQFLKNFEKEVVGFDLIHTVELRNGFSYQAALLKKKGLVKKITATIYEDIPFLNDGFAKRKKLKEFVIPYIDHFFAASLKSKACLEIEGVDSKKISVIAQGVDTKIFNPSKNKKSLRKHYGLKADSLVCLSVGRMVWEKGWNDIILAAYYLQKKGITNIQFLFVGDGGERKYFEELINKLGLEKICILIPSVNYKKMPEVFSLSDIFLHAPIPTQFWDEQFGRVIIEAMSSGLPIIATQTGAIVDIVEKQGGILIPPHQFEKIAESLEFLLSNYEKRNLMGHFNRKRAIELYEEKKIASEIGNIWTKLLKEE